MAAAAQLRRFLWLGLLTLALAACSGMLPDSDPVVGNPAPDFTLSNLQGEEVSLSDYRGQPVVVNFWATWCGPCVQEMPLLAERSQQGDFQLLAVDFAEPADQVSGFLDSLGVDVPALLDPDGATQALYLVRGYPTTFFIDEEGIIQGLHLGALDADLLDSNLALLGVEP